MSKVRIALKLSAVVGLLGTSSAALSATTLFTYTGAKTTWTAASTGTYRVTAVGAAGSSAEPGRTGGRGAEIAGTFTFTAGNIFQIAIGGMGGVSSDNGGGGGGTFFVDALNNPLLVAGGGGGTRVAARQNGTDASITQFGYTASGSNSTYTPVLKLTGLGQGGIASSYTWGSAGAGFYSNGGNDGSLGTGGQSWANGLAGGVSTYNCFPVSGGFGGGGSGNGCAGGGGGGGYSGGDGGWIAGGGGSFNLGADQFALRGVGTGNGWLQIEQLSAAGAVPEPATWAMLIVGFGAVGSAMRRSRRTVRVSYSV